MKRTLPDTNPATNAVGWGRATAAVNPLDLIAPTLTSAAGSIEARGLWKGRDAGISVVAAISQSAYSLCPTDHARPVARAAEIVLMQHLGIDPDQMSLRAIATWEDSTDTDTEAVAAALRAAAVLVTARYSKVFEVAA